MKRSLITPYMRRILSRTNMKYKKKALKRKFKSGKDRH